MKYLSVILIIILSFNLVQVEAKHLKHLVDWGHYNSDSHPPWNQLNPDWMKKLPDNKSVSELSIPGTHDSGTYPGNGGAYAQCQSWNIYDQLRVGIRFLDIRFGFYSTVLGIYHGVFFQTDLQPVFTEIGKFLTQHPKEFIIMLLAQEGDGDKQTNQNAIEKYFDNTKLPYYYSTQIPTVGQLRGKVWILKNTASFPDSWPTFAFRNKMTDFDDTQAQYILQNNWEAGENDKKFAILRLITKQCYTGKMVFNWMNIGATILTWPYQHAKSFTGTNQMVQRLLKFNWNYCVGIMIMDFPGANLIRLIIRNNFV